jgi:ABC-type transport system substrate-binding protein
MPLQFELTKRRATRAALVIVALATLSGCANVPYPKELDAGKTYFKALTSEPTSLDPSFTYNANDDPIVCMMFPSYYRFHYLRRNPYKLELNIGTQEATREKLLVDDIDAKGKTTQKQGERWTFTIRKDMQFQDDECFPGGKGRPVTAADVVYSFKRMADPKVNCPVMSYVADKIVGFAWYQKEFEDKSKKPYEEDLPGVKLDPKDPYTFTVTLNQPYPQLKYIMAMHFTAPQASEAVKKYGDQYGIHHPVGCGLFKLAYYREHEAVLLVRNEHSYKEFYPKDADPDYQYMLQDAGMQLPFVDSIYLPILTEPVTAYNLFQQGYLDSLTVDTSNAQVVSSSNSLTKEMSDRGIHLVKNNEVNINYLGFNMEDSLVGGYSDKKRKLRQAISLAVDTKTNISLIAQGMAQQAQWLIPPGLFGYDPNYVNPYRVFDPNLVKAKQLLAEAGYPGGIDPATGSPLVIAYDVTIQSPIDRESVRLLQKEITALGVHLEIRGTTYPIFNDRVIKKQIQFFGYGWLADYPDPENFTFLLYGPNESPGPNGTLYHNPEYDKLFEQMRSMEDGPERLAIIKRMRDISVEDCTWIYTSHSEDRTLLQPWASNIAWHPIDGGQLKYVRVDPEKRVSLQNHWNSPTLWPLYVLVFVVVVGVVPAASTIRHRINRRVRADGSR